MVIVTIVNNGLSFVYCLPLLAKTRLETEIFWQFSILACPRVRARMTCTHPPASLHTHMRTHTLTPTYHANCIRSLGQRGHGVDDHDHDHGIVRARLAAGNGLVGTGRRRTRDFPLTQCRGPRGANWQLIL